MTARECSRATEDNPWGAPIAARIISVLETGPKSIEELQAATGAADPRLRASLDRLQREDIVLVETRYRSVDVALVASGVGR